MPTPEQIAKARSLLASGNIDEATAKKLRAAIGEPEPSAQPEPAAVGGETEDAAVDTPEVDLEPEPPKKRRHMKPQFPDADKPLDPPSKLESAAFGILNGASLGHADDIFGLFADGDEDRNVELFRDEDAKAKEANPKTHFAGSIGGGVAPAAAATYLGAGPALSGGILGGFQGHGDADDAEGEEMAARIVGGAATGAGIGKGMQLGAPYVKKLAGWAGGQAGSMYKLAERLLARGAGATGKQASEAQGSGKLADVIRVMREKGVLKGLPTQRQMGDRAEDAANMIDEELTELANPDDIVIPPRSVSKRILKGRDRYGKGRGQRYRDELTEAAREVHRMPQKSVPNPELARAKSARGADDDYIDAEPFIEPEGLPEKGSPSATDDELAALADDELPPGIPRPGRPGGIGENNGDAMNSNAQPPWTGAPEMPPMDPPPGQAPPNWPGRGPRLDGVDDPLPKPPSGQSGDINYGEVVDGPPPDAISASGTGRIVPSERTGIPMGEALKERYVWGKERNFESDSLGNEVRDVPYAAWNDATEEALNAHGVDGKVWRNLNFNKSAMRTVQDWSHQTPVQPPGIIGQVLNPVLRAASFGRHNVIGAKLLANPTGPNSAAGLGYGLARGAQRGLSAAGRVMDGSASKLAVGGRMASGEMGNAMGRMTAQAMEKSRNDQKRQLEAETQQSQQVRSESAGWRQPEVMKQVFKTNPQVFGQFTKDVANAVERDEPAVWSALLQKLEADRAFRTKIQPDLLKLTSRQQQ